MYTKIKNAQLFVCLFVCSRHVVRVVPRSRHVVRVVPRSRHVVRVVPRSRHVVRVVSRSQRFFSEWWAFETYGAVLHDFMTRSFRGVQARALSAWHCWHCGVIAHALTRPDAAGGAPR